MSTTKLQTDGLAHRIAKEIGDAEVATLCEVALGDLRSIVRAARWWRAGGALRGAKR